MSALQCSCMLTSATKLRQSTAVLYHSSAMVSTTAVQLSCSPADSCIASQQCNYIARQQRRYNVKQCNYIVSQHSHIASQQCNCTPQQQRNYIVLWQCNNVVSLQYSYTDQTMHLYCTTAARFLMLSGASILCHSTAIDCIAAVQMYCTAAVQLCCTTAVQKYCRTAVQLYCVTAVQLYC